MTELTHFYHCTECKKILEDLEDLLFIEENSNKGFCSEVCIEKYYTPLIQHIERQEKKARKKAGLPDEPCLVYVGKQSYMESVLTTPMQIWQSTNELGEELYSFIGEFKEPATQFQNTFYLIILCTVYNHRPSFIFTATATKDKSILKEFQRGVMLPDPKEFLSKQEQEAERPIVDIEPEAIEFLEVKKSQILAHHLEQRSPADIPFEKFALYDDYFELTLNNPDEVFQYTDEEGDEIYTYIKAHDQKGVSFYYFIMLLKVDKRWSPDKDTLLPIISFPSVDGELYNSHRKGAQVTGSLKN